MTLIKFETDALTGETIEREYNEIELQEHKNLMDYLEKQAAELEQLEAIKASRDAKLKKLGLSDDEIISFIR